MTEQQLYTNLRTAALSDAVAAATAFLHEYRRTDGFEGMRIINEQTGQPLPSFTANGKKYRVLLPEHGMSLERATAIQTRIALVGSDLTLSAQQEELTKMWELASALAGSTDRGKVGDLIGQIFLSIKNAQERLQRGQRNWKYSDFAAAAICIREGEDARTVDLALDEEKINDYNEAMIYPPDFFFLALLWEQRYNEALNRLSEKLIR